VIEMKEKKKEKTHGIQLLIRAVVRDPDGKVISDTGQKPARSFVIQFLEFLYFMFVDGNGGGREATTTGGAEENIYFTTNAYITLFRADAAINDNSKGVVLGTGEAAVTNEDYNLGSKIGAGSGAGQFIYEAHDIGTAAVVGPNVDLVLKRSFINNSGSSITVKEAGVLTRYGTAQQFLIIRDLLTVPVPDMYGLTITYTLRTTV